MLLLSYHRKNIFTYDAPCHTFKFGPYYILFLVYDSNASLLHKHVCLFARNVQLQFGGTSFNSYHTTLLTRCSPCNLPQLALIHAAAEDLEFIDILPPYVQFPSNIPPTRGGFLTS